AGTRVGSPVVLDYGQKAPAAPALPRTLPANKIVTVSSTGGGGLRYRVLATPDRLDSGLTVVAVPLRDVDQTLHRLLLVEGLVIAIVLLALGAGSLYVVRLGLLPLERMAVTAGQ